MSKIAKVSTVSIVCCAASLGAILEIGRIDGSMACHDSILDDYSLGDTIKPTMGREGICGDTVYIETYNTKLGKGLVYCNPTRTGANKKVLSINNQIVAEKIDTQWIRHPDNIGHIICTWNEIKNGDPASEERSTTVIDTRLQPGISAADIVPAESTGTDSSDTTPESQEVMNRILHFLLGIVLGSAIAAIAISSLRRNK